jgi:hypothetical protein
MNLTLLFTDYNQIDIELFDIPAVRNWFNHFKKIEYSTPWYTCKRWHRPSRSNIDEEYINLHWQTIIESLKELDIDLNIPDQFNFDQNLLNKLHRFFTSNNGILPFYLLDPINLSVHKLERFTIPNENRLFIQNNFPVRDLHVDTLRPPIIRSDWIEFTLDERQSNYGYLDLDVENLVLLDQAFLGKSVLQTFFDNDDPSSPDCTGRLGSYGGFYIESNSNRKNIYKSEKFIEWAESFNLDPTKLPYEFPIGFVKTKSQDLDKFMLSTENFETVLFKD